MARRLSILDTFLFGYRLLFAGDTEMPERPAIKFVGDGVSVEDDPDNNRTTITIGASVGDGAVPITRTITSASSAISVSPADGQLDEDLELAFEGLQNDDEHGERGGGTLHPIAVGGPSPVAGFMSGEDKAKLDSLDSETISILANAEVLVDATATNIADGRAIRALAEEIPVEGAAGVTPWSFAHKAAAGSVGRALRLRRTLTSSVGSAGTGVDVGWYLPDGFGDEALVGTDRVEATSVLGTSVSTKRVFALGGTDRLTIKVNGILQAHAYTTGVPHFDSSGNISSSPIVNADVAADAAIECTKTDGDFVSTPVLSDGGFEPSTAGEPLTLGSMAGDVDIGQTGVSTTTIHGDLVVTGTTTSINSTTVNFADRVCHVNASALGEGAVPVPTQIAGIAIDRGTADGTTKRDMPFLGWQESNSRILFCYNTAGDDQTVGAALTVACAGVQAVSAGAFKVGDSTVTTSVEVDSTTGTITLRAGGTVIGTIDVAAGQLRIRNGAGTSTGINIATTAGLIQLTSIGALGLESTTGKILLNAQNEVEIYDQGVLRGKIQMSAASTFGLEGAGSGSRVNLTAEHLVFNAAPIGKVNTVAYSATPTFDLKNAAIQRMTLTGNVTSSTFSDGVADAEYEVQLIQDSTGGRTFAWPSSAKFPDNLGANPDVPGATANTMSVWKFRRYSTAFMCTCVAKNISLP